MPLALERLPPLSWRQLALMIGLSLAVAVVLAEVYQATGAVTDSAWLAAALVHSAVAFGVVVFWLRRDPAVLAIGSWRAYAPAAAILLGTCALGAISRNLGGADGDLAPPPAKFWAWVLWVPVVEELVFRAGIGVWFRRFAPPLWAAWFGALVFALVHANPTVANVVSGKVGLALGPFLLGLCCDGVFSLTKRILPAIALHAACNATVALFGVLDGRWLHWLGLLYS